MMMVGGASAGGGGGVGNKVVATLRADGKVYPTEGSIEQIANLMNYKIRTEGDIVDAKPLSTLSVPTTIVDLGKQLLQYARDGDLKGVKNMLSRGAPFTSDWLGMSALHFAAMNNQYDICVALLRGGINKDWKTKVDRSPLHFACFQGNERIVELLLSKECAINPRDMLRMTPLHWAVEKRHKNIVRMLLKHNADVTLMSKFGKTPIALAVLTEQADLLQELEAARQTQAKRKFSEEHEKETSEAVNSIMGLTSNIIDEPEAISKIDQDIEDEFTNQSDYNEAAKIVNFENIKTETGTLDNSTINLLKSHGISMIQDNDNDTSKELLTSALKNGRQLVLSEGGKLLLDETKRIQQQQQQEHNHNTINIINNNNNQNNHINHNHNSNNTINKSHHINSQHTNNNNNNNNRNIMTVPVRIKNDTLYGNANKALQQQQQQQQQLQRNVRTNILKTKHHPSGIAKNKNIRIISLNDFKKLYGNANIKTMQKIPASLASSSRMVKQISGDGKVIGSQRKMVVNMRQLQNRQIKVPLAETTIEDNLIEEEQEQVVQEHEMETEDVAMSNIIQIGTMDTEMNEASQMIETSKPPMHIVKQRVVDTMQVCHIPPQNRQQVAGAAAVTSFVPKTITSLMNTSTTTTTTAGAATARESKHSTVIPLLSIPEICRQLIELRKENEDLRRNFDLAQKEKEELRQRLDHFEELLLVEKTTDDVYTNS